MGQKSKFIETTPREAEIIANTRRYRVVINKGRGERDVFELGSTLSVLSYAPLRAGRRKAIVYAIGKVGGIEVNALWGTWQPGNGWKTVKEAS